MRYDCTAHIGKDEGNLNVAGTAQETTARYHQLIAIDAEDEAKSLRDEWKKRYKRMEYQGYLTDIKAIYHSLQQPDLSDITCLPQYSFAISFELTLASPFVSRDDLDFYIVDNPIKKDRILGIPFIAPPTWKGSLRNASRTIMVGYNKKSANNIEDSEAMRRLFGNSRTAEDNFVAGRVQCFPTFFLKSGLEIINPHDRGRKVGVNPILIETIPRGATGTFTLLYMPFDMIGMADEKTKKETASDLRFITKALKTISADYGIGAKTSSGFGLLRDEFSNGCILINAIDFPEPEQLLDKNDTGFEPPDEAFLKYMDRQGVVLPEFLNETGELLSTKQYVAHKNSLHGGSLSEYKKFRQWYTHYGQKWKEQLMLGAAKESEVKLYHVKSFSELEGTAKKICEFVGSEING